jgi:hypothetical protein
MEPLDSVEADLDSVLEVPDSVTLNSMQPPDSVEVVPDSIKEVPDSVALDNVEPPDSVDEVPDSVEEVQCPRCGIFHAGGVFGEACFQGNEFLSCQVMWKPLHYMKRREYDMERSNARMEREWTGRSRT